MKMSPQYLKAQLNMAPGKITKDGFLGDDLRPLSDIIQKDEEVLESLGMDIDLLAAQMRELMRRGVEGLGEPITVDGKWLVKVDEARGRIPCPFEDELLRKRTLQVKNLNNQAEVIYSDVSIHLLEKHHFLQGWGSTFRLEPEMLKKVFE